MKKHLILLLVLLFTLGSYAGTRTLTFTNRTMMTTAHLTMEPSDDGCPMDDGDMEGCDMDSSDMGSCDMDGMDDMMNACHGGGGMMGLTQSAFWTPVWTILLNLLHLM